MLKEIDEFGICVYGCGKTAAFILKGRGGVEKPCCSPSSRECPSVRTRIAANQHANAVRFNLQSAYPKNLTGLRFGKLIVQSLKSDTMDWNSLWKVRCDCGEEKFVKRKALIKGKVWSCGCLRLEALSQRANQQMIGRVFGRLRVLSRAKTPPGRANTEAYWLCRCECGNEKVIKSGSLNRGATRSCGCRGLDRNESVQRVLLSHYKTSARKRGIAWEISNDYFFELIKAPCFYCGDKPQKHLTYPGMPEILVCNGVDRFDSNKGYLPTNCVSACSPCNYMKLSMTAKEFGEKIRKIAERHPQGILHPTEEFAKTQGITSVFANQ